MQRGAIMERISGKYATKKFKITAADLLDLMKNKGLHAWTNGNLKVYDTWVPDPELEWDEKGNGVLTTAYKKKVERLEPSIMQREDAANRYAIEKEIATRGHNDLPVDASPFPEGFYGIPYNLPPNQRKAEKILKEVNDFYFDEVELKRIITYKGKKLRPNQKAKLKVQEEAKAIWGRLPKTLIKHMADKPEIMEIAGSYEHRTRRNWVAEVAPKELKKPGRRKGP